MQATDAIDEAENLAERPKRLGAEQAEQMAKAVHKAADQLQDQMPKAAEFVHRAASQLEKGADTLRRRGMGELVGQFNDLGRREPLALFGAALAAGFVASRFFKSSGGKFQ
jgi:uncharacterized protein Yka (UPF0111/DUF47 family)